MAKRNAKKRTQSGSESKSPQTTAGQAYRANNPKWKPSAKWQAEMQAKVEAFRQLIADLNAEWMQKYGRPMPRDLDEWELEATRAGVPVDHLLNGSWTARSVAPYIEGHLQRLKDEAQIAALRVISIQSEPTSKETLAPEQVAPAKPKRPGAKPKTPEEDLQTLREAAEFASVREYERQKFGRVTGRVSQARRRLGKKFGGEKALKELLSRKPSQ